MLDLRYLPQALKAKELLDSGRLGEIRNLSFGGQHCLDRAHRPSWYFEEGMHGGTINDIAIHGIDLVRMLTGLEFTQTDAARAWNSYASDVKHFRDSATFMARLENGAGVLADVSYSAPAMVFSMPTYWEFRFWCANGLLTFNYAEKAVKVYENKASAPCTYDCADSDEDYLTEFIRELNGKSNMTENILASTKTALLIQGEADKELL
jgi:predicted dehydrogenase